MTRDETKTALHIIAEVYDNFKVTSDKVDIWHKVLQDFDAVSINNAIAMFIRTDTKGFAPIPGQLVDLLVKQETKSDGEAWEDVNKALCNGLYGYEEEFKKLDPLSQKCVGSARQLQSWAMLPSSEVQTRIRSQFLKDYRVMKERAKQDAKIPQPVLEVLRKYDLIEERKE